jgi:hypothetical protein
MATVTTIGDGKLNIKAVKEEAAKQISDENNAKAKVALVKKLRELDSAQKIVANIQRDIADLEASIVDGSFAG